MPPKLLLIVLATLVVLPGCGSDGPSRVALSGIVTRAGQPLESGSLSCTPAPGQRGVAANATIAKGRYQFSRDDGPTPGLYKVLIQETLTKDEIMKRRQDQPTSDAPVKPWVKEITVPDSKSGSLDFEL